MDEKDKIDLTGTFVQDGDFTRKLNTLRTIAQPERATVDTDTLRVTSRMRRAGNSDVTSRIKVREAMTILEEITEEAAEPTDDTAELPRPRWAQRLLGWLGRS